MPGTIVKVSYINTFNPHSNPIWKVLLSSPFYRRGIQDSERLDDLFNVTQLAKSKGRFLESFTTILY